jgi:hypothetical protein
VIVIPRRKLVLGLCSLPLLVTGAPLIVSGCGKPQTPLAHLYGQGWVHGAYEFYGKGYHDLQSSAEQASFEAYRVLAQKGVLSLDQLQAREVPFHIRVDDTEKGFRLERDVPDVLTFRADMTEADRQAATAAWEKAREHIQTDYAEIQRLEWALTRLLQQLQHVRGAIEKTRDEQFRLTRQVGEVQKGELPFELPYEVKQKDYEVVLVLLIERLEDDKHRLEALEGDIMSVGLTVRATDAGSASLAANIRKVLLAVVEDSKSDPRPITFPATEGEKDELLAKGRELYGAILKSPEYAAWVKAEQDRTLDQIGSVFSILDQITGLPTSAIYRTAVELWRGSDDYFGYLKKLSSIIPGGREVTKAVEQAIDLTDTVRKGIATGAKGPEAIAKALVGQGSNALLNTGTKYAKDQIGKQLVFFENEAESSKVAEALKETKLMQDPLPKLINASPDDDEEG